RELCRALWRVRWTGVSWKCAVARLSSSRNWSGFPILRASWMRWGKCSVSTVLNIFAFIAPTSMESAGEAGLAERLAAGFLDMYHEKSFVVDDPALRYCNTTVRPFRWFREAPYDPDREPRAVELVQRARDFGMVDGFMVPVVSPAGRIG